MKFRVFLFLLCSFWGLGLLGGAVVAFRKAPAAQQLGMAVDYLRGNVAKGDDRELAEVFRFIAQRFENGAGHGRWDEIAVLAASAPDKVRLQTAAAIMPPSGGRVIDGKFRRGEDLRGAGQYADAGERDRVELLRRLGNSIAYAEKAPQPERRDFFLALARACRALRDGGRVWQLGALTDLSRLPDYEARSGNWVAGFPVDAAGRPTLFAAPKSWTDAKNDGERMAWAWRMAGEGDLAVISDRLYFCHENLRFSGDRTLHSMPVEAQERHLSSIPDGESLIRLVSDVKRVRLPQEYDELALARKLYAAEPGVYWKRLAEVLLQRCRFAELAEVLKKYGKGHFEWERIYRDLTSPSGKFEDTPVFAPGKFPELHLYTRNADTVAFTLYAVDWQKLWAAWTRHLVTKREDLSPFCGTPLGASTFLLNDSGMKAALGRKLSEWTAKLKPGKDHFTQNYTFQAPVENPGLYLLKAEFPGGNAEAVLVQIAPLTLGVRPTADGTQFIATGAVNGKPVAGAEINILSYQTIYAANEADRKKFGRARAKVSKYSAVTGADGAVLVKSLKPYIPCAALVRHGDAHAIVFFNSEPIRRERLNAPFRAFVIGDSPLYRAGDTARFSIWLRHAGYGLTDAESVWKRGDVTVVVSDPRGTEVARRTVKPDADGQINFDYPIPKSAGLGRYSLSLQTPEGGWGGGSFRVEDFQKPEFKVSIHTPGKAIRLGEPIFAAVDAEYYFGLPVVGARVTYRVTRENREMPWFFTGPWDWLYGPGSWRCSTAWSNWFETIAWSEPELVVSGEGVTGPDGKIILTIPTSAAVDRAGDFDSVYRISVDVTDTSRRTISERSEVLAARKPVRFYAWTGGGFFDPETPVELCFSARSPDGAGVAGSGSVQLWSARLVNGKVVRHQPVGPVFRFSTTTLPEPAKVALLVRRPGAYLACAEFRAADGSRENAETPVRIAGPKADDNGRLFGELPLEISTDRAEYRVGETARILISSALPDRSVWVAVRPERGEPQFEVIQMRGYSVIVPVKIESADQPNTFVEARLVANGKVHHQVKEILVPPEKKLLNVEVTPAAAKLQPGGKGSVRIRVTDLQNRPVAGRVAVSIYDEALEGIAGSGSIPAIRNFFWGWKNHYAPRFRESGDEMAGAGSLREPWRPLGILSWSVLGRNNLLEMKASGAVSAFADARGKSAWCFKSDSRAAMADAAPGVEAGKAPETIRENFADRLLWIGNAALDEKGETVIDCAMPDNLTTWKVRVWSLASGCRVGEGQASIVVAKEFMARLELPRFLVAGDRSTATATIHNATGTNLKISAQLATAGSVAVADPKHDAQNDVFEWSLSAEKPGEAEFTLRAEGGPWRDALRRKIPVLERGSAKMISRSGVLLCGSGAAQSFVVRLPGAFRPGSESLQLQFTPSPALAMLELLPYLGREEGANVFSIGSRYLPALAARAALLKSGVKPASLENLKLVASELGGDRAQLWQDYREKPNFTFAGIDKAAAESCAMLGSMQNADGGWGWFSGVRERSWPDTTSFVVIALLDAREAGCKIDEAMLKRALKYLEAQRKIKDLPSVDLLRVEDALTRAGRCDREVAKRLMEARKGRSPYYRIVLARICHRNRMAAEADTLLDEITQFVRDDDVNQTSYVISPRNWFGWWFASETVVQSEYLAMLLEVLPDSPRIAPAAKYLVTNLRNSPWSNSPRSLRLGVTALARFITAGGEGAPDYRYQIRIDGEAVRSGTVNAANMLDGIAPLKIVPRDGMKIEITGVGQGALYWNSFIRCFDRSEKIQPAFADLKIERTYWLLAPVAESAVQAGVRGNAVDSLRESVRRTRIQDLSRVPSGALVEVELNLTGKNDYDYVEAVDPLPAGFVPEAVKSGYMSSWPPVYAEYRTGESRFYLRSLGRGNNQIRYRLRAQIPGTYTALPATAKGVYAPELFCNSASYQLGVTGAAPSTPL